MVQPLDTAIATAVVGPPMLALEARIISSRLNFNNFPAIRLKSIFTITMIAANKSSNGEFLIIIGTDAGTPITKKNR